MILPEVRELLEILPEPAVLTTSLGRIEAVNGAFCELLGQARADCEGALLADLSDTPEQVWDFLKSCARVRQLLPGCFRLRTRSSGQLPFRCEGGCVSAAPGSGRASLLLLRFKPPESAVARFELAREPGTALEPERPEPPRGQEALDPAERLLRQFADAMPQIVWAARPDGYIDYYNRRWYEFTGFPEGYGDASWKPVLHPEDVERCFEAYYNSIQSGRAYEIEYRFRDRRHGGYRWFLGRALPVRDETGQIIRWFGTCTDIDEVKRAEIIQARLAAVVESSDDAIISKTPNGIIETWNQGAERLFGYAAAEAIGQAITMLIPAERAAEEQQILNRIRKGERVPPYETVRLRKGGIPVEISLTVSPVRDAAGRIVGASKIARDITERKRAERALAEAQEQLRQHTLQLEERVQERTTKLQESLRSLDAFCYTMAHDLRAPLRAMIGFSRELQNHCGPQLDPEAVDFLARIHAAGLRMDQLILDLLQYGRLDTVDLPTASVTLDDLVWRVLGPLEGEVHARGARVRLDPPLLPVLANPLLMEQVLSNLLANALKFVPSGRPPEIQVWTESYGSRVRLCVRDNGIGIQAKHLPKLFQPFVRLVNADVYPGTGIGLAIVRKAVERMGGKAGVESEFGRGSCFWIELPKAPGETGLGEMESDQESPSAPGYSAAEPDGEPPRSQPEREACAACGPELPEDLERLKSPLGD